MVFNAVSRRGHSVEHVGCLSLKIILNGEEWYDVDRQRPVIRPGQLLVLNDDQPYSCSMERGKPVRGHLQTPVHSEGRITC